MDNFNYHHLNNSEMNMAVINERAHKSLALFDFDGTLTRGDSLWRWLFFALKPIRLIKSAILTLPWLVGYRLGYISNNEAKGRLLSAAFGGMYAENLRNVGRLFAEEVIPQILREDMMARVTSYQSRGYECVLVSASLDYYLEPWARCAGFVQVLCSSLKTDELGKVGSGFAGLNCHGAEKVARIQRYIDSRSDCKPVVIVAYGDSRGDIPMMELAREAWWVTRSGIEPFTRSADKNTHEP
ncbi:HAD family hydrolase [Asaia sp. VD9]|uniref:HAD family hydrolase n=1 Tax=Asaia sp. VD9 TaxID=3081235 RepID=UPI003019909E